MNQRERIKKKKRKFYRTVLSMIFFSIFLFCLYNLYKTGKFYHDSEVTNKQAIEEFTDTSDGDDSFKVNWKKLLKKNSEIIAWIRFPGDSEINYPVCQHSDNSYYLNHNYKQEYTAVGSIFMDSHNKKDLTDNNTIIYGHRMNNGSMFHELLQYKDPDYCKSHDTFYIYTPDGKRHTYKIWSAFITESGSWVYTYKFADDESFDRYISKMSRNTVYDYGIIPTVSNHFILLSTCTKQQPYRQIISAVETDVE